MDKIQSTFPLDIKDRMYKLTRDHAPETFVIQDRHKKTKPLLFYDKDNNLQRELRYATNQRSPFVDEQQGHAIMSAPMFVKGFLRVPKENPALQWFLSVHPDFGKKFVEVDKAQDASKTLKNKKRLKEATDMAYSLSGPELDDAVRVILGFAPDSMTADEKELALVQYAESYPEKFLKSVGKSNMEFKSLVMKYFERELLQFRNGDKEVWFRDTNGKFKKLITLPYKVDKYQAIMEHFETPEGRNAKDFLDGML